MLQAHIFYAGAKAGAMGAKTGAKASGAVRAWGAWLACMRFLDGLGFKCQQPRRLPLCLAEGAR